MADNYIIYDYITFTSKIHNQFSVIDFLGLQDVEFETLKGFYGYKDRLYYDGISIHYNGRENMGICVEMSGKGCRTWEKYGSADYDGLFSEILENYSEDSEYIFKNNFSSCNSLQSNTSSQFIQDSCETAELFNNEVD